MDIKVNDNFRIASDKYQYILIESYEGQDKDGNSKIHENQSYYPSLELCLRAVRDSEVKQCETIDHIFEALTRSYALDRQSADNI